MHWPSFWAILAALLVHQTTKAIEEPIGVRNKFILYYGSNSSEVFNLENGNEILKSHCFNNSKKTVIYIHGYIQSSESSSVVTVVEAYRQRDDHNIIVVDWRSDASGNYALSAYPRSFKLANYLTRVVYNMVNAGLDLEKLHLVGHSTGAHMMGVVGRGFMRSTGQRIRRITALDPAGPLFQGTLSYHLSPDDARLVDAIHTDANLFGTPVPLGRVNFWPNGGRTLQPGCPKRRAVPVFTENSLCSHWESWRFWAESVASRGQNPQFNAVRAKNWKEFQLGITGTFNESVVMGLDCPTGLTGNYYLQTNNEPPYAKGEAGTKYQPSSKNPLEHIFNNLIYFV